MGSYQLTSLPYEIGFTLLALALFKAGRILGTVRALLKGPALEILAYSGSFLLLVSVAIHVYASLVILPSLGNASGPEFDQIYRVALTLKHASIACLAASGLLGLLAGIGCYRLMSR
jgi:hypothetical protein